MLRFAAFASLASALAVPAVAQAGRIDPAVRLAMEGSVGVAYIACTSAPALTPGSHKLTLSAGGSTVSACKVTSTTDDQAQTFSNDVEVARVSGVTEAAARLVVVGENFDRESFDSDVVVEFDGDETRPYDDVPATGL